MTLTFSCPCGQELQAREEHAGRRTRCPKCGQELAIPAVRPASPPAPPARPEAVTRRPPPDTSRPEDEPEREASRPRRRRGPAGTSAAAVVSLVLGILSPCLLFLTGLPAIILGIVSLRAIGRSGGRLGGRGLAVGGIILGIVGLVCTLPALLIIPAYHAAQTSVAKVQSRNNLKQLALAMHNFNDVYGRLPPAVVYDRQGKPLYSWRVLILPYVEEDQLYKEFHLNEAWDSPHNKPLLARMPKVFAPPGVATAEPYATFYQVLDGPRAAFDSGGGKGLRPYPLVGMDLTGQPAGMEGGTTSRIPATFLDGTSRTFLIVEGGEAVPWSKPGDVRWDPNGPLPKLGGLFNGDFHAAMADATVRIVKKGTPERAVRAAITASGGETDELPP
jgi:hypothetical protein